MTKRRFGKHGALAASFAAVMMTLAASASAAQQAEPPLKAGKPIKSGEILSGELTMMEVRDAKEGRRVPTYQITSEPRRLPQPGGLCNLETGPETFQLITSSNVQTAQLKALVGKAISVKVDEVACAQDAGQMSEAVVTKWSLVRR
jgi:hypothetical protein